jgi:L-fuculose-phosphate aldolase
MSASELEARRSLVDVCRRMNAAGINQGKSGNASVRATVFGGASDAFLVTPTAVSYDAMTPEDIVLMKLDGTFAGRRPPSSEWRMHRDLLAHRPDLNAVVHAHPPFSTALACVHRSIPAFHYMVAVAGGDDIRCAPYATFGTQELSDHALRALEGRKACLLANHGLLAAGLHLDDAFAVAIEVEALAEQYTRALALGEPVILDAAEMAVVLEKFKGYGRTHDS